MPREVWVGRIEVAPQEGNDIFEGAPGAFANALVTANSFDDYREQVTVAFATQAALKVVEIKDAEPLRVRMSRVRISDELVELGGRALHGDVVWDTLYVFESDEPR